MVKFSYKIYFWMLKHFKTSFNLVFLNFIYAYSLIISIPNFPLPGLSKPWSSEFHGFLILSYHLIVLQ